MGATRRRRHRQVIALIVVLGVALFGLVTDRAFVQPRADKPSKADAIVVLGGNGARIPEALRLFDAGYSHTVVLSVGNLYDNCPRHTPPGMRLTCFVPHPFSTQGEGRYVGALARSAGWRKLLVVSGHAQTRRARLRIERCWNGQVLMEPAPREPGILGWWDVAYEWGATLKAELWQRSC